ncbi:MAG: hypothetical protein Q7U16_13450 [Agitococcus sp.]|nr:hypothetical protein [Agitococcus sp.]
MTPQILIAWVGIIGVVAAIGYIFRTVSPFNLQEAIEADTTGVAESLKTFSYRDITVAMEAKIRFHLEIAKGSPTEERRLPHETRAAGVFSGWVALTAHHRQELDYQRLKALLPASQELI